MKNAPKLGSDDAEKVKGKEFGTKENDLQPAGKKNVVKGGRNLLSSGVVD